MDNSEYRESLLNPRITKEHIQHLEKLEPLHYEQYIALYQSKLIKRLVKFKTAKQVYWDEDYKQFVYWNKFTERLNKCAVWKERIDENGKLIPLHHG